jgi:integrase
MSTETKLPPGLVMQPALSDVLDRLPMVPNLSERRRKELASAVRSFCRIVESPVDRVIVCAPVLWQMARRATPAAKAISRGRWANVLCGVRRALHLTGILQTKFRSLPPPAPIWTELLSLITPEKRRIVFVRLARYCTALAINPEQVDDEVICLFRQAIEQEAFGDPSKLARLCRAWNQAAASLPDWPKQSLTVPSQLRRYGFSWSVYPESLRFDVEHYLAQSLAPDPLDPDAPPPVRPATIVSRRQMLRQLAAARVNRGTPAAEIQGLGDLVRPAALRDALLFFIDRGENALPAHVAWKAFLARSIARDFLKLPNSELAELDRICKPINRRLREHTKRGLTEKNRRRLAQFLDDRRVVALRDLPQRLQAQAKRRPVGLQSALTMQSAVAIELFIMTLLRSSNVRRLSYPKHFVQAQFRGRRVMHLLLSGQEVKNSEDLELPLPERTTALLNRYMEVYQPILSRGHKTDFLFPGRSGQPKSEYAFVRLITSAILEQTGIKMNLHLFRHLGAFLYLSAHEGEYETVRRLLGHKSKTTTTDFYVGLQTVADFRRYDEVVLNAGTSRQSSYKGNER